MSERRKALEYRPVDKNMGLLALKYENATEQEGFIAGIGITGAEVAAITRFLEMIGSGLSLTESMENGKPSTLKLTADQARKIESYMLSAH